MKKQHIAIILGIVCMVLTMAIFTQIRTIKSFGQSVGTTLSKNSELIDEVIGSQEENSNLYKALEMAEAKLEIIRKQAIAGNQEDTETEKELKENNAFLGLFEMKGEGIVITLDDNRNVDGDELNISQYLVHEGDLLHVVNELFNAGAEAISINDNRIVTPTAILCDGNIIRVNGKITTVPIKIKAICSTSIYNTLIRPKGYLQIMKEQGVVVDIKTSNEIGEITVPKYDGIYSNSHLTRGED